MIRYTKGNLLEAPAEALVNTVNEIGVMGKGVALMFREAFPKNAQVYQQAAKAGDICVGRIFVTEGDSLAGPQWILHFPTKRHWRQPSKIEWIRDGLRDLVQVIHTRRIQSVALPPLGCGSGGLDWYVVRREIEAALDAIPNVDVLIYEPTDTYQNMPKGEGVKTLTVARALIAELIRRYEVLDLGCTNLEVQKLAWFVCREIDMCGLEDTLALQFKADRYGPYSDRLRHLLNAINGSYLHCERRLADAGPKDLIWFDESRREEIARHLMEPWAAPYRVPLEKVSELIDGFESPFGMELLATVDWLVAKAGCATTVQSLREGLSKWPGGKAAGRRKQQLFDDNVLGLAINRLVAGGLLPSPGAGVT